MKLHEYGIKKDTHDTNPLNSGQKQHSNLSVKS